MNTRAAVARVEAGIEAGELDALAAGNRNGASPIGSRGRETLTAVFDLAARPDLTHVEFRMWCLIRKYDFKGEGTFVGDETLQRDLGIGVSYVRKARAALLSRGYLRKKSRGPKPAMYWAVVPEPETVQQPYEDDDLPWD